MRNILLTLTALAIAGCNGPAPGLRFAPGEEIKQNAQVAADLCAVAAAKGLPPGSAAVVRMAQAARTQATYTGSPREPIDTADLTPPGIAGAWRTRDEQVERMKLREAIYGKVAVVVGRGLAELATDVQNKSKIAAGEIIHRIEAMTWLARAGAEIAAAVRVPDDEALSEGEKARLAALDALVRKIGEAAAAQAARKPTAREVAEKTAAEADNWIDLAGGFLGDYGLLALIPGAGGVVYGARKRKEARRRQADAEQQKADANSARHDEMHARHEAEMAKQTASEINARAMELLAKAQAPNE